MKTRLTLWLAVIALGCGGDSGGPSPTASELIIVTAPGASAVNGVPFGTQPTIQVRDASGADYRRAGVSVTSRLVSGSGTLGGTTTRSTDSNGQVRFTDLQLDGAIGSYVLEFVSPGLTRVEFGTITLQAGSAHGLSLAVTPPASAQNRAAWIPQPIVQVVDASGNTVADQDLPITASLASTEAALEGELTRITGATGRATFANLALAGSLGVYTVRFTSPGLASVESEVIVTAGAPSSLATETSGPLNALIGEPLSSEPIIRVLDQDSNPVPGVPVAFTVTGGGGSIATLAAMSNSAGAATPGKWTLGGTPGPNTLKAEVEGMLSLTLSAEALAFDSIAAGSLHTCAIMTNAHIYCWGYNGNGQLGTGDEVYQSLPTAVVGPLTARAIASGHHSCALPISGNPVCWGNGSEGQLGDGASLSRLVPTAVSVPGLAEVDAGSNFSCGLTSGGNPLCWGNNSHGRLGDGTTTRRFVPTPVDGSLTFVSIAVSNEGGHACGLDTSGSAWCWGNNFDGELGDGTTTDRHSPTPVQGGLYFQQLALGNGHTCGIDIHNSLYCWGRNTAGQFGDGSTTPSLSPKLIVPSSLTVYREIVASGYSTCGLRTTGQIDCWGANVAGKLGDGSLLHRDVPTPIASAEAFRDLDTSGAHVCAVTEGGLAYCWGDNRFGQVGDGTEGEKRTAPVRVRWR